MDEKIIYMLKYLKLIRYKNLLVIILTQYLVRFCVLKPIYKTVGCSLQINEFYFFLLVFSVVLIAAAGYIINDYFDIKIDKINKPEKVVLDTSIQRRNAILFHSVFNFIAILISFIISYKIGAIKLGFIFLFVSILLWFYSLKYKRLLFTGNFIVAVLSAFVVYIVWLFEFFALRNNPSVFLELSGKYNMINIIVLSYTCFAFLISFIREVIKDMEDVEGDEIMKCRTIPVVFGIKKSKIITGILILLNVLLIAVATYYVFKIHYLLLFVYLIIAVIFPYFYLFFTLTKSKEKSDFHLASNMCKIIMLAGILSMQILSINFPF